jgi:hypothetical protein
LSTITDGPDSISNLEEPLSEARIVPISDLWQGVTDNEMMTVEMERQEYKVFQGKIECLNKDQ